jgi:hypothetical protein
MKKVIFAYASESARMPAERAEIYRQLEGNIELFKPDESTMRSGNCSEWIRTKAGEVNFVVILFSECSEAGTQEGTRSNLVTTIPTLTREDRARICDNTQILVLVFRSADRNKLPEDIAHFRSFDMSTVNEREAFLCLLAHEPVHYRPRVVRDATSAVVKMALGGVATLIGASDSTTDFVLGQFGPFMAQIVHYSMAAVTLVLLFAGLVALLQLAVSLLGPLLNIEKLSVIKTFKLRRQMIILTAAASVILFGAAFFPKPPQVEKNLQKHLQEWVNRLGESQRPNGGIREHHDIGLPQVWSTAQGLAGLLASENTTNSAAMDFKRAFHFVDQAQIATVVLAPNMREDLQACIRQFHSQGDLAKLPPRFPTYSFALATIAWTGGEKELNPELEAILNQKRTNYFAITPSPEGWGYFEQFEWGVTEIAAWTAIAKIQSLRATNVLTWRTEAEREATRQSIREIVELLKERQLPGVGGFSPVTNVSDPRFIRTYSTVMALWAMAEACSPELEIVKGAQLTDLEARMIDAVRWLSSSGALVDGKGWKANPSNPTTEGPFLGLTAQIICVLGRMPVSLPRDSVEKIYNVKKGLLSSCDTWAHRNLRSNDRIADSDCYLYPTQYMIEPSTFLWYPWCIALTRSLSTDRGFVSENVRIQKVLSRLKARAGEFGNIVQSDYNYVAAEALIGFTWPMDNRNK